LHDDLLDQGETCSENRVARLASLAGIAAQIGYKRQVKLTLVKTPRRPHPKIICVIYLLARQAARHAFAEHSTSMSVNDNEGTLS